MGGHEEAVLDYRCLSVAGEYFYQVDAFCRLSSLDSTFTGEWDVPIYSMLFG